MAKYVLPRDMWVSIRARPTERAILRAGHGTGIEFLFQSAPAQLSGRYEEAGLAEGFDQFVSIRARPTERAILPGGMSITYAEGVSIRARPTERAIRY